MTSLSWQAWGPWNGNTSILNCTQVHHLSEYIFIVVFHYWIVFMPCWRAVYVKVEMLWMHISRGLNTVLGHSILNGVWYNTCSSVESDTPQPGSLSLSLSPVVHYVPAILTSHDSPYRICPLCSTGGWRHWGRWPPRAQEVSSPHRFLQSGRLQARGAAQDVQEGQDSDGLCYSVRRSHREGDGGDHRPVAGQPLQRQLWYSEVVTHWTHSKTAWAHQCFSPECSL